MLLMGDEFAVTFFYSIVLMMNIPNNNYNVHNPETYRCF